MENRPNIQLEAVGITKRFGGVTALDNVNLKVHTGKVNVIVGENGAGKSTLMKILSGVYPDYEGKLFLNGEQVRFNNPKEAMQKGIAIMHQELNLIPYLSIAQNIFLGREIRNTFGMLDTKRMIRKTQQLLARLDCNLDPRTLVSHLRVGEQQMVEIAKALLEEAQIVIMDEPTSAISESEVESLFKIIRSLKEQNVSILYISHKLDELFVIADRFIGMRDGKMVGTLENVAEAKKDDLIRLMVGRDIKNVYQKEIIPMGEEVLRVEKMNLPRSNNRSSYVFENVSFTVKKGEILGIFGLMGAGRTELLETIFGMHPKIMSGRVFLENKEVRLHSVRDAINCGIGLVPEDRKEDGLVLQMEIMKNVSMANIRQVVKHGLLDTKSEADLSKKYISALKIKTPSEKQLSKNLSGGNQQKVVLAKWLATDPKVLFLDEPTRGIDVNAKNEIYHLIGSLAKKGLGMVVVSSELPEIMAISDRILVLSDAKISAEFNQKTATEELIMRSAVL